MQRVDASGDRDGSAPDLVPLVYTVEEAARALGWGVDKVRSLVRSGEIPHTREGGRVTLDRRAVAEWSYQRSLAGLQPRPYQAPARRRVAA